VFAIVYRCLYVSLVLYIAIAEYQKDGDLVAALTFSSLMAAALELIYWIKTNTWEFSNRLRQWFQRQQEKAVQDRRYPNVPLLTAVAVATVCIGLAAVLHISFPESCDPESRKWLFRVAICKQPFRSLMYSAEVGGITVLGVAYLVIAYRSWRR
jgi:hypothetical protein